MGVAVPANAALIATCVTIKTVEAPVGSVQVTVIVTIAAVGATAVDGTLIVNETEPSAPAGVVADPRDTVEPPRFATAEQVIGIPGTTRQAVNVIEFSESTVGPDGAPPLGVRNSDVADESVGPSTVVGGAGDVACACAGSNTPMTTGVFQCGVAILTAPAATIPRLR